VEEVGRIELAKFVNPAGLRRIGNNLFIQTDASGEPVIDNPGNQGLGTLLQGYLDKHSGGDGKSYNSPKGL